jgi:threonine aldolase
MSMIIADLRSDTVTRPTEAMLKCMFNAKVGDDVLGDDPSVIALEEKVADLLGFAAALFVPSGTMANQIALRLHTRPGDSVICEENSHCYLYEGGAAAALSGIQLDQIPFQANLSDASIDKHYRGTGNVHLSPTTLLVIENTHNRGAGRALSSAGLTRIVAKGRALGLKLHCDGARIWNAAIAVKQSEKDLLRGFDTAAVCFSKGLGAPVGSALLGAKEHIAAARVIRKRFGGGMRQAGYLAAAAHYALDHHRERLVHDHDLARKLAQEIKQLPEVTVLCPEPMTNMIYVQVAQRSPEQVVTSLARKGILISNMGDGWLRAVTHLDVPAGAVAEIVNAFKEVLSA